MTRDDDTTRRRFLLGTAVAIGTAGLAGCGVPGGGEDEEEGGDDEEGEEEGEEGDDEEEEQLQAPDSR